MEQKYYVSVRLWYHKAFCLHDLHSLLLVESCKGKNFFAVSYAIYIGLVISTQRKRPSVPPQSFSPFPTSFLFSDKFENEVKLKGNSKLGIHKFFPSIQPWRILYPQFMQTSLPAWQVIPRFFFLLSFSLFEWVSCGEEFQKVALLFQNQVECVPRCVCVRGRKK